jgi:hypothetical protein
MTMFGWRPTESCYVTSMSQTSTTCPPAPVWFYLALLTALLVKKK